MDKFASYEIRGYVPDGFQFEVVVSLPIIGGKPWPSVEEAIDKFKKASNYMPSVITNIGQM